MSASAPTARTLSKARNCVLDPELERWIRRVFSTEAVLQKRLKTNKGSWEGMTSGAGVKEKTVENLIFRFLDLLRELHARNFLNTADGIHGVAAAKAYEQYASYIASADVSALIHKAEPKTVTPSS